MSATANIPIRVGLNAMFLTRFRGGMATATLELTAALCRTRPELRLTLYASADAIDHIEQTQDWADAVRLVSVSGQRHYSRAGRVVGELAALPLRSRRDGIDVLHSLANLGPPLGAVPHVLSIHDLLFWHVPETHPGLSRPLLKVLTPLIARRATLVATPSDFTRDDVIHTLGVNPRRVRKVSLGPGLPPSGAADDARARRRHDLGDRPVVLSIGAAFAHKNVDRLLEAFARVGPQRNAVLVHVGPPILESDRWMQRARDLGIDDDVRWPSRDGFVDDAGVEDLFAAATLLAHPSRREGFGLPPLEAMVRGLPVACARASSLPEVAGDAAEYFDPEDVDDIAAALARLLDDPIRRAQLVECGLARYTHFTWDRCAEEYATLYAEAFRTRPPTR